MGARMASVRAAGGRPLLRNGRAVHCSHICLIHPELQCVTHGRQRNGVVLWSPAKCPGAAADCAGAKSGFGDQDTTRAKRSLRKRHCSILRLKTAPTITAKRTFRRLDASMQSNRLDGRQLCACVRFDSHSLLRFTVAAPVWLAERVCHALAALAADLLILRPTVTFLSRLARRIGGKPFYR